MPAVVGVPGAVGDGQADDTEALQRFIFAARESGRPAVLGRGLRYRVSATVDLSEVEVIGNNSSIIAGTPFAGSVVYAEAPVSIADLTVTGEGLAPTDLAVSGVSVAAGGGLVVLSNLTVEDLTGDGLVLTGEQDPTQPATGEVVLLRDCVVRRCARGARVHGVGRLQVERGLFSRNSSVGLQIDNCTDFQVSQTQFNGNGARPHTAGDGCVILYSQRFRIVDVMAAQNTGCGINLGGGDPARSPNFGWTVSRTRCLGNGLHGITVDPTVRGREGVPVESHGMIDALSARSNKGSGVNVTCAASVDIVDLVATDNQQDGLAIASANVVVSSARVLDNRGYGLALYGGQHRPRYGGHRLQRITSHGNGSGSVYVNRWLTPAPILDGRPIAATEGGVPSSALA